MITARAKTRLSSRLAEMAAHGSRGLLMGCADLVPGVSGATLAYMLGIYPRLIASLALGVGALMDGVRCQWRDAWWQIQHIDWLLLLAVASGMVVAFVIGAPFVVWWLNTAPALLFGFFFGVVMLVAYTMLQQTADNWRIARHYRIWLLYLCGVLLGVLLSYAATHQNDTPQPALWWLCIAAMAAISAMLLPGISGSFVLLLFGAYEPIIGAIAQRSFAILLPVGVSMAVAMMLFVGVLQWLITQYKQYVCSFFGGIVLSGLLVLSPWPKVPTLTLTDHVYILLAITAGLLFAGCMHLCNTRWSSNIAKPATAGAQTTPY